MSGDGGNGCITISLDCMGGDKAPYIVVAGADYFLRKLYVNSDASPGLNGAADAVKAKSGVRFLLYGDRDRITPVIKKFPKLEAVSKVIHTDVVVSSDERPSVALRKGKKSSMRLAIDAVKENRADAVVCAGNTGALMAMSKVVLRTLPSIDRPAIVTTVPNKKYEASVLLDMGANIECDSGSLCQFAVMGHAFAKVVLGIKNPKIGLLNVGSEELKGSDAVRTAYAVLKDSELGDDFYGYVEGDDIVRGVVDVVVSDGFSGNIALKAMEGTAKLYSRFMKDAFKSSILSRMGYLLASFALKKVSKKLDPRLHNGAMFVGLNGVTVKSHGGTDEVGFANAIKVAVSLVEDKINDRIVEEVHNSDFGSGLEIE